MLRRYGLQLWERACLAEAMEAFGAALVFEPDNADLWRDLASVLDAQGHAAPAETCVRESLRQDPGAARSWLLLANQASRSGRPSEAEAAFGEAIRLDPTLGDAYFGLGLLQFSRQQLIEACRSLREAVTHGYDTALGFTSLGHVCYLAGDFAGSAGAFESAIRFGPLDAAACRKYARARTLLSIVDGDIPGAIAAYPGLAGPRAEALDDVLRDTFSQLSAYGQPEAALALGRFRLEQAPDDPMQRYLLDALSGRPMQRAPVDYLEYYFDRFAATFDHKLVDILHYDAPALMARLVDELQDLFDDIVDLGCGTGLAAPHLAPFGGQLTGVDVSGRMLEEARKCGLYAHLEKQEALEFLDRHEAGFDLIFAADMVIYFGDLERLFAAAHRALRPGGLLALSIETAAAGDYTLLSSGRFAHTEAYLRRTAAPWFDVAARQEVTLRLEAARPADGVLLVLRRR